MGQGAAAAGSLNPYVAGGQAALGLGMGLYQTISGAKEKRAAEKALENYERQELKNVYDDVAVSTLGADRQIENQARLASSQIAALKDSGTRGLMGGLGRVEVGNQNVNQQIAADLDQQQKAIDYARAGDQSRIRSMTEDRENADIAALSSQYQAGRQDQNTGLGNMVLGAGMLGNSIAGMKGGAQGVSMPQQELVSTMQPAGFAPKAQNFRMMAPQYPTAQFGQFGNGMFAQPRVPQVGYYN